MAEGSAMAALFLSTMSEFFWLDFAILYGNTLVLLFFFLMEKSVARFRSCGGRVRGALSVLRVFFAWKSEKCRHGVCNSMPEHFFLPEPCVDREEFWISTGMADFEFGLL